MTDLTALPWRQGRSQPRNVYARTGGDDWKADVMIGQLDTAEMAREACEAHNERLAGRTGREKAARETARYLCSVTEGHSREAVAATAWSLADVLTSVKADRERLASILIEGSGPHADR